eukprot:8729130-Pyramimonas_sp.AAC.1
MHCRCTSGVGQREPRRVQCFILYSARARGQAQVEPGGGENVDTSAAWPMEHACSILRGAHGGQHSQGDLAAVGGRSERGPQSSTCASRCRPD